ncbi:MAG: hypothetical protein Tsb006_7120 [Rickettsiaceae bacterium]
MVKGEYLKIIAVFVLLPLNSYADAWLPEPGSYNVSSSYLLVDKKSQKRRSLRSKLFIAIQDEIARLGAEKGFIHNKALELERNLLNSEIKQLENIDREIKELEQASSELFAFSDDNSAYFELEYGATDFQSFGVKVGNKVDKFVDTDSKKNSVAKTGKDVSIYYKYKFYECNNVIATVRPRIYSSAYKKSSCSQYYDLSLLLGHSKARKSYSTYFELGITARKYFSKYVSNNVGYVIATQEGIKFTNGFSIINFTEYEKAKFANILYRQTVYNQFSIAKEFQSDNLKPNYFTIQVGYFWKGSLVNRFYTVSGPVISLWLNL